MYEYNHSRNDGIYAVVDGAEYLLSSLPACGDGTKCCRCDFHNNGKCAAPSWCLKVESAFPDSVWKRTSTVWVECSGWSPSGTYCHVNGISKDVGDHISQTISVNFAEATRYNNV